MCVYVVLLTHLIQYSDRMLEHHLSLNLFEKIACFQDHIRIFGHGIDCFDLFELQEQKVPMQVIQKRVYPQIQARYREYWTAYNGRILLQFRRQLLNIPIVREYLQIRARQNRIVELMYLEITWTSHCSTHNRRFEIFFTWYSNKFKTMLKLHSLSRFVHLIVCFLLNWSKMQEFLRCCGYCCWYCCSCRSQFIEPLLLFTRALWRFRVIVIQHS